MMPREEQFALRMKNGSLLWCQNNGELSDGRVLTAVLGHAWTGAFDGVDLQIRLTREKLACTLVWEGFAPFRPENYEAAKDWIEDQIANHDAASLDADAKVGDYVYHPPYLEMRLRIALTGRANPSDEQWATALRHLLDNVDLIPKQTE